MNQTTSLTGLSGWLSQILGELDTGAALNAGGGADFVQSLASQIRSLMLKHGADPSTMAAIDDQTLVSQCLALMADQQSLSLDGLGLGLGEPMGALLGAATEEEQPDAAPDHADGQAEDSATRLDWLPLAVLERLSQASAMLRTTHPSSVAQVAQTGVQGSGQGASLSVLDALTEAGQVGGRSSVSEMPLDAAGRVVLRTGATELASGEAFKADSLGQWAGLLRQALLDGSGALAAQGQTLAPGLDEISLSLVDAGQATANDSSEILRLEIPDPVQGFATRPAADAPAATARAQVLDLNRLLQPGGEQTLAAQVRWSVEQGLDTAEIKLHPPSLGSLEVRVVQDGDRTHVHFVAAHPVAREVLDAALPRLRESLAQEGVWLGNVSVSDQTPRRDQGQGRGSSSTTAALDGIEEEEDGGRVVQDTLAVLARRLDVFT